MIYPIVQLGWTRGFMTTSFIVLYMLRSMILAMLSVISIERSSINSVDNGRVSLEVIFYSMLSMVSGLC